MRILTSVQWDEVKKKNQGFVYNGFGSAYPRNPRQGKNWNPKNYNVLHHVSCNSIKSMSWITGGKYTKYFFETLEEAEKWLATNKIQFGYTTCERCLDIGAYVNYRFFKK